MGKFDGILFLSDFDNTILYTAGAMKNGGICPEMPERNLQAIRYFIEEGGYFGVATGRAMVAFAQYAAMVPTNVPTLVNNGGSVYDYTTGKYVETLFLKENSRARIASILEANPDISVELFYPGMLVQVFRESRWNKRHFEVTRVPYEVVPDISPESVKMPLSKVLFLGETEDLKRAMEFINAQPWRGEYEMIFSSDYLLELAAHGAEKGAAAKRMMERLGCEKLVCAGDHLNDLSMLLEADYAFCPSNAVEEVRANAQVVCHCQDGAIADMIAILEKELSKI
ncbi:MAG: HAD-IIB family hydrolase [Oscillospiraceae bacterium]|nr:HAD-IIB family hydrolase [Oscillospiraceae bacterium]